MANDGQVVFELTADGTKAKAEIDSLIKAFKEAGIDLDKDADKTSKGIESKFVSAFKKISIAAVAMKVGKALLDFGKDAIQAASDLEEVQNVVDVTFGDDAAKIEKWAKEAGTQFGLTETQAKKFTSTLGAMMKSAGLAGPEIVDMSTDLAGLAADMASFYNLDFEEAFQKIRSGISGETEPLKQLGINMSVANLEAFALTQGIDKAFSEMTQGEQTMLRYQYLMQATADAQGDFARTSDGYANAVRTLETNIASLKTSVGEVILPIISSFVSDINNLISAITTEKPDTVLDDFAAIDLDTAKKMAEIEATANKAADLVTVLEGIQGDVDTLSRTTIDIGDWSSVLDVLDKFGEFDMPTDAGQSIVNLADALNGNDPNTDRATAWQELLAALSTDIDSLSKLTGKSPEETKQWLEEIATAANQLNPNSAEGWGELFGMLTEGLPGLTDTNMAGVFGILAGDSENAARYLEALGFDAEEVADAHEQWLRVCRQLVNTIPGLNEIINTETGEVKGGIGAITDYYTEWKDTQEKILKGRAYYAKQAAIQKKREELSDLQLEAELEQIEANRIKGEMAKKYGSFENLESMAKRSGAMSGYASSGWGGFHADSEAEADYNKWLDANNEAIETSEELIRQQEDLATAEKNLAAYGEENADVLEAYQEAANGAADATAELTSAWDSTQTEGAIDAINAVTKAVEELNTYYDNVWESTRKGLDSVADGFGKITTPAEKVRGEMVDLEKALKDGKITAEEYEKELSGLDKAAIPSIQNMTDGLEDQLEYWKEYYNLMELARSKGVSEDILAYLSDGSTQSFDYLKELTKGSDADIERINNLWAVNEEWKNSVADQFTDTKLGVDDTYQAMVDAAQRAAEELDVYGEAANASEHTVQGIADGIRAATGDVASAVDALNAQLGRINPTALKFLGPSFKIDASLATGLDYVPFNGFLAQLHEGESVLTAEEARVWRDFKTAGASSANTIDYEAMGGVMRDNIKPGGNVYLDGNIVGRVVSDRQGNALRQLERSGWQR